MLRIELVRAANGTLVGKTFSDRWNLHTLMGEHSLPHCRNQRAVKALRRQFGAEFAFTVVKGEAQDITRAETVAMFEPYTQAEAA